MPLFPSAQLTQDRIIHQSSAVLCFNIPNRLTSLAATKILARMKVVVVTIKTALPREWDPPMEDIGKFLSRIPQLISQIRYQIMVDGESNLPLMLKMRFLVRLSCSDWSDVKKDMISSVSCSKLVVQYSAPKSIQHVTLLFK